MSDAIPYYKSFDCSGDQGDICVRWTKWVNRLKNLLTAMNVTDSNRKRALLLHYLGDEGNDIFDTLEGTTPAHEEDPFDNAVSALTKHFAPKKNREFEIFKFRQAKQLEGEDTVTYTTRLRQLAATCEFTNLDAELKTQIIQGCKSAKLRRKALSDPSMDLTKLVETARLMELSDAQCTNMATCSTPTPTVNKLTTKPCRNCGGEWPHTGQCPAKGKQCRACKKFNHFADVCLSKHKQPQNRNTPKKRPKQKPRPKPTREHQVNTLAHDIDSSDDEESYLFALNTDNGRRRHDILVAGQRINVMIDSGADVNILDEHDFASIKVPIELVSSKRRIYPYGSSKPLKLLGKFRATIQVNSRQTDDWFHVTQGKGGSLLGCDASLRLHLIELPGHTRPDPEVGQLTSNTDTSVDKLVDEFPDVFSGLGKLKDFKVKLHIDSSVTPVAQPHRRIPFHVRKQLEEQLAKDEELGVIEKVEGPTPWLSPVVVVPKKTPGKVRVCVDMRKANTAIIRERHITPTINELINDLNGSCVFSKLDLNQGYNQLELDENSRYITTFSTHFGLWRYKRLNFGISSAWFSEWIKQSMTKI